MLISTAYRDSLLNIIGNKCLCDVFSGHLRAIFLWKILEKTMLVDFHPEYLVRTITRYSCIRIQYDVSTLRCSSPQSVNSYWISEKILSPEIDWKWKSHSIASSNSRFNAHDFFYWRDSKHVDLKTSECEDC